MRWSAVFLGVMFSLVVVASPAAAMTTVPALTSSAVPSATALVSDAVPLPIPSSPRELPASTPLSLTFTLTNPRSGELGRFLDQVEDPASPSYRHFLTYPEFVEEFAPPGSSVARVEAALDAVGARDVTAAADRSSVTAVLPARSVEQLLGVDLRAYGSAGRVPLYTAVGTVSLPPSWRGLVSGVGGLSNSATTGLVAPSKVPSRPLGPLSADRSQFARDNGTGEDWFLGSDYTQAYGATELFPGANSVPNATYPTSVAIATLLGSAYNQTHQANLPPWDPSVIDAYFNGTLGPGWPMPNFTGVPVTLDNVTPPSPGPFGSLNDSTAFETENSLDLEMAGSLAPGSSVYNFYFAGSLLEGSATVGDAADYFAADLAQALAYHYSPAHLASVSCSFGLPDLNDTAWNAELLTAAATGVTIVSASGDQGNAPDSLTGPSDGQWPIWPATAASNTSGSVAVGGVSLTLSGTPNSYYNASTGLTLSYDPTDGAISGVSAWYDTSGGQGAHSGTEGGVSPVYPEPSWQFQSAAQPAVINATVLQGATALGRSGPDVAMPGNATIVTDFANSTGAVFFDVLEGTSVATPVLAGLLADVVAVENHGTSGPWTSLGFIDPEIYRFASFFAAHPGASSDPFLDVTAGRNYVFSAAPGWDPTTGWGGVDAPGFLAADQNGTLLHYVYTGPTPGLPPGYSPPSSAVTGVPWPYIFAIFGVGIVVAIVLVAVAARPSQPRSPPSGVPWGAQVGGPAGSAAAPPPGGYPGATFLCPYCGAIRPAEPVRCPQCQAF
ncbi:MAG TPA: protease pro-enzyme activation domain-containing protein [Thermoplasmata archaeon]